jgi:signal transduction histidine kinase
VPLVAGEKPFGVLSFIAAESGRHYTKQDLIMATEIGRRASLAVENSRLYGEARAAVEIRDTFLSVASHELRTPLTTLSILTTSLVRAAKHGRLLALGDAGIAQRLEKADRQAKHLARLVDRLLDVTRLSAGDLPLERTAVDLTEVAREVIGRFEDSIEKRVELRGQGAVTGHWDRARIDQVVTNLISNAIKYGGETVEVEVDATGGEARLVVRDDGPGISAADQARVWNQFERAAPPNIAGMGLGLWIVRRIVQAHGGDVSLASELGGGTSFIVTLPLGDTVGTVTS